MVRYMFAKIFQKKAICKKFDPRNISAIQYQYLFAAGKFPVFRASLLLNTECYLCVLIFRHHRHVNDIFFPAEKLGEFAPTHPQCLYWVFGTVQTVTHNIYLLWRERLVFCRGVSEGVAASETDGENSRRFLTPNDNITNKHMFQLHK